MTSGTPNPLISARPRLRIAGQDRPAINAAVLEARIRLPLSGMAQAELRLLNWAADAGSGGADFAFGDIALGDSIEVMMSETASSALFDGEVTALEERYGDGAPQLVLLAEDRLHRLARQRHNRSFEAQSLNDVANNIAGEAGLDTDIQLADVSGDWHQINESNLAFLLRLAAPYDIALRLQDGTLRLRPEEADSEPVQLANGDNVRRLRLIADLNRQPASVEVRGYNPGEASEISASGDALSPAPAGRTAADHLNALGWAGETIRPQPFARSQAEADAQGSARFRHAAKRFIHGDIHCQGEPALRAGREIELAGVSARLRGTYQVVDCVHSFDRQDGYQTHLKVQRPDWNP